MTIEIDESGNVIGYLSIPQYCKKYGVKETTARQWCNRNMIPHIKVGRETWIKDGAAPVYKYDWFKDRGIEDEEVDG